MAIPIEEARRISREIRQLMPQTCIQILTPENNVVVTGGKDGYTGKDGFTTTNISLLARIIKTWTVTISLYEGLPALIIW